MSFQIIVFTSDGNCRSSHVWGAKHVT